MIYTNQTSKLSKKARAKREALLAEQRAIKADLKESMRKKELSYTLSIPFRSTSHIPSVDTGTGSATVKEQVKYTGDAMIGIGQMHKSNAVPVFKQEDAEALANMRR